MRPIASLRHREAHDRRNSAATTSVGTSWRTETCTLFRAMNELGHICLLAATLGQQMNVIRHEAVHSYFHVAVWCNIQNLLSNKLERTIIREVATPVRRAECQQITLQPDVERRIQTRSF